ncbi:hypothetical protein K4K53_009034 [Colletotrichum sp. SAR 10_77]|nr:hypothetical protein K4K53_009034 [Colletotrichum sp. SAR 10_77]
MGGYSRVRRRPLFRAPCLQLRLKRMVHAAAQRLCDKFLDRRGRGPLDVAAAYSYHTADIISEYCFGEPFGFLY